MFGGPQADLAAIFYLGGTIVQEMIVLKYPIVDYVEEYEDVAFQSGSLKMCLLRCDYVSYGRTPLALSNVLPLNYSFHLNL